MMRWNYLIFFIPISREKELHVLFNNGSYFAVMFQTVHFWLFPHSGVMFPPIQEVTADGYDLQFGTNVLGKCVLNRPSALDIGLLWLHASGHFYFTKLLLPTLTATARSYPGVGGRVVNVSSAVHYQTLNFNTFKDGPARKKMSPELLYAQSKFVRTMTSDI